MAQEQFAGPDYYTEFDPEKIIRQLREQAAGNTAEESADTEQQGE